jgi:hypothetical protein
VVVVVEGTLEAYSTLLDVEPGVVEEAGGVEEEAGGVVVVVIPQLLV